MKVWVVTKGIYSDYTIVAIKSNKEAASRLMKKCSYCIGTGQDPYYDELECDYCYKGGPPPEDCEKDIYYKTPIEWNKLLEMEVEDE